MDSGEKSEGNARDTWGSWRLGMNSGHCAITADTQTVCEQSTQHAIDANELCVACYVCRHFCLLPLPLDSVLR